MSGNISPNSESNAANDAAAFNDVNDALLSVRRRKSKKTSSRRRTPGPLSVDGVTQYTVSTDRTSSRPGSRSSSPSPQQELMTNPLTANPAVTTSPAHQEGRLLMEAFMPPPSSRSPSPVVMMGPVINRNRSPSPSVGVKAITSPSPGIQVSWPKEEKPKSRSTSPVTDLTQRRLSPNPPFVRRETGSRSPSPYRMAIGYKAKDETVQLLPDVVPAQNNKPALASVITSAKIETGSAEFTPTKPLDILASEVYETKDQTAACPVGAASKDQCVGKEPEEKKPLVAETPKKVDTADSEAEIVSGRPVIRKSFLDTLKNTLAKNLMMAEAAAQEYLAKREPVVTEDAVKAESPEPSVAEPPVKKVTNSGNVETKNVAAQAVKEGSEKCTSTSVNPDSEKGTKKPTEEELRARRAKRKAPDSNFLENVSSFKQQLRDGLPKVDLDDDSESDGFTMVDAMAHAPRAVTITAIIVGCFMLFMVLLAVQSRFSSEVILQPKVWMPRMAVGVVVILLGGLLYGQLSKKKFVRKMNTAGVRGTRSTPATETAATREKLAKML